MDDLLAIVLVTAFVAWLNSGTPECDPVTGCTVIEPPDFP